MTLYRGEPAVFFSKDEVSAMAVPFKLSLIGKFSFGRPSMELIRKFFVSLGLKGISQISLLDQRHVLIKLSLEEDYTRVWLRQSWFINGRSMRVFKWSTNFRCSEESSIVPVWISLPYLPIHFVNCKQALHSIAAAVGKPLRVDQATASGTRPSVARVLIEFDICQPLIHRIWIGEGEQGFWQEIIFEKIPPYCVVCKYLGHEQKTCYISNPDLRVLKKNNDRAQGLGKPNSGKTAVETARPTTIDVEQPMHILENAHRNPTPRNVTLVQTVTGSREAHADEVQEMQKKDALAINDQHVDTSPHAINEPATVHAVSLPREAHITTQHEKRIEANSKRADDKRLGHAHSEVLHVTGTRDHGDLQLVESPHTHEHCPMQESGWTACPMQSNMLVSCQRDGVKAAQNDATPSVNLTSSQDDTPHLVTASADMGNSAPGPSESQAHLMTLTHAAAHGEASLTQQKSVPYPATTTADVGLEIVPGPCTSLQPTRKERQAHAAPLQPNSRHDVAQPFNADSHGPSDGYQPNESQAQPMQTHADGPQEDVNQPIEEGNAQPHFQPNSRTNLAQQTTAHVEAAHGFDSSLGHQPNPQLNSAKLPISAQAVKVSNLHLNLDKSLVPAQFVMVSKEVSGHNRQSSHGSSSAPNSFSFQAGYHISYNPNPTMVEVDILPMPKPIYASEDYITEGTIDDSDSYFMPDYSHVEFNTHSHVIPDESYYGPVSRSHSLDAQESRDDDFILARCGISDSAIDNRNLRDEDGTIKAMPRKTRQYHLRPRNRRR